MSHGEDFSLSSREKKEHWGWSVWGCFQAKGQSKQLGSGNVPPQPPRDTVSFPHGYASSPGVGCDVTLTSNKDHSECGCAVGVISALEGE